MIEAIVQDKDWIKGDVTGSIRNRIRGTGHHEDSDDMPLLCDISPYQSQV